MSTRHGHPAPSLSTHAAKSKFASGNRNRRAGIRPRIATNRTMGRALAAQGPEQGIVSERPGAL